MIKDIKEKIKYFKNNYKSIFKNIKENFKKREYQKRYVIGLVFLAIINILIINIFMTYAYYTASDDIPIIEATVGDFSFGDYVLLVYIEDIDSSGRGTGEYRLTSGIPTVGYKYKNYNCKNNSKLNYDDNNKTTNVTIKEKEVCSIYFDLNGTLDLSLKIMLEDKVGSDKYIVSNDIPTTGYTYNKYTCINGSTITYNNTDKKISLTSPNKDYCTVYFKKNS